MDIIASHFGFEGLRSCIVTACASSTMAIGSAADAIRDGRLDAAIAGGTDAMSRLTFSGFNAIRVMDPEACRPFDRARAGMNLGEGAAMLVLEDLDGARRRGATIYAEVAGHSLTCEAFHPTSPEPDGRAIGDAIGRALADGSVNADEVDHVNAHGTATPHNDRAEARGIRLVFGERAGRLPVTSVKSMIGHCLGAAGGLETAITALTIARGVIPPTLHHQRNRSGVRRGRRGERGEGSAGALRGVHVARLWRQRFGARAARGVAHLCWVVRGWRPGGVLRPRQGYRSYRQ